MDGEAVLGGITADRPRQPWSSEVRLHQKDQARHVLYICQNTVPKRASCVERGHHERIACPRQGYNHRCNLEEVNNLSQQLSELFVMNPRHAPEEIGTMAEPPGPRLQKAKLEVVRELKPKIVKVKL